MPITVPQRVNISTTQQATGSAGAAAAVTLSAPGSGKRWAVWGIVWSYDAAPTGGKVTLTVGGTTVIEFSVTSQGPGFIPFALPMTGGDNQAIVLTLAAPGGAVVGRIGFVHAWTESVGVIG